MSLIQLAEGLQKAPSSSFTEFRWNPLFLTLPQDRGTGFSCVLTQMDTSVFRMELYPESLACPCGPEDLRTSQISWMHEPILGNKPYLSSTICHLSANHLFITCYLSINHHHHQPIYIALILLPWGTLAHVNVDILHYGVILGQIKVKRSAYDWLVFTWNTGAYNFF